MFQNFFYRLKSKKIPVSTIELLDLIQVIRTLSEKDGYLPLQRFYYIARSCLIKDIKFCDDYDLIFADTFGDSKLNSEDIKARLSDWLSQSIENLLS